MITQTLPLTFFQRPLRMTPHYTSRPWGGHALRNLLAKSVPEDKGPIGESWELSDHPDGRSKVEGHLFGDLLRTYPQQMLNRDHAPEKYPILVKYIDAEGDLSVQVHPDDAWCRRKGHNDRGKTECWYIMDCKPGTKVVYGYKRGVTEADVRQAIAEGRLKELLRYQRINPGDFVSVPAGCVHAMLAGTLVCEIQQSSNTTFRLYDWDRQPPRELHIEQSMEVSELDSNKLPMIKALGAIQARGVDGPERMQPLLDNDFFTVQLYEVSPRCTVAKADFQNRNGLILNVVAGSGTMSGRHYQHDVRAGDTYFLPAALTVPPAVIAGEHGLRILVTESKEV